MSGFLGFHLKKYVLGYLIWELWCHSADGPVLYTSTHKYGLVNHGGWYKGQKRWQ